MDSSTVEISESVATGLGVPHVLDDEPEIAFIQKPSLPTTIASPDQISISHVDSETSQGRVQAVKPGAAISAKAAKKKRSKQNLEKAFL